MTTERSARARGRIIVARVGLDGHDRGAKVLMRLLRDEGFEVIYLGVRTTPLQIARVALDEWVDVVAISLLSGAHLEMARAVRAELDAQGLQHVSIAMGGLIPDRDAKSLQKAGVARCFHLGQTDAGPERIIAAIDELVAKAHADSLVKQ